MLGSCLISARATRYDSVLFSRQGDTDRYDDILHQILEMNSRIPKFKLRSHDFVVGFVIHSGKTDIRNMLLIEL